MATRTSRRAVLGGLGASVAQILLEKRIFAIGVPARNTGDPGAVDLSLTALTSGLLRISIAPVNASPPASELGVVERRSQEPLVVSGPARAHTLPWGKYSIEVSIGDKTTPLRIAVAAEDGMVRQKIEFGMDSTAVRFGLGRAPLFGLGEGVRLTSGEQATR